ncbi:MAG: M28 family peptidase [Acidobacteriota bacterium]|nr:M28 family peptidase [Acidobacteriota bacterium]
MTPLRRDLMSLLLLAPIVACASPEDRSEPAGATSDGLPAGSDAAAASIDEGYLATTLRDLSSDEMEGRGPGTPGDARARKTIAEALASAGVKPGAADGSWEQPFDIVGITSFLPDEWSFSTDGGRQSFRVLEDYVAASGLQNETASLADAELVFVGFGIRAPEHDWDDYKSADLKGKVLLMMNNDPDWDPRLFAGATRLYYGRWTYKYEVAAEVGAAGAIIIHTNASAGYPWQVVQTSWTGEQFELPAAGEPRVQVEGWLTEAAAAELVELAGFDLDELRQAARTREFEPVELGITTSMTLESTLQRTQTANVIGLIPGRDSELAHEAVIFTAHHDHLGMAAHDAGHGGPPAGADRIYNGAKDNASGTAMVMAMARAAASLPEPPRRSLVFAFVGAEEQGLLGSQHYASHPTFAAGRIAANINLDGGNVLGRTTDVGYIGYGRSSLDGVIEQVVASQGRMLRGDEFPDRGFFYRSDQFNFAKIGVPALYIKPGIDYIGRPEGWGREQAEAYTLNDYHQPSDEFHDSWSFDGMAEDAALALLCGLLIAEAEELPSWNRGDEFAAARAAALARDTR